MKIVIDTNMVMAALIIVKQENNQGMLYLVSHTATKEITSFLFPWIAIKTAKPEKP